MRLEDAGNGIARESVQFFREHRHLLGEIVEAAVRFPGYDDPFDPYLMVLTDAQGSRMRLSGCTSGYAGEAPRAAMVVLTECGFDPREVQVLFTAATAHFTRQPPGPPDHGGSVGRNQARPPRASQAAAPSRLDRTLR